MEQGQTDRILRVLAVLGACVVILLAIAIPVGQLTGAAVQRPSNPTQQSNSRQQAAQPAEFGGYAYLLPSPHHKYPGRWCPGGRIKYTVDFSQALAAGLDQAAELNRWRDVFRDWNTASKGAYRFRYAGEKPLGTSDSGGERQVDIDAIDVNTIGVTYVYGGASDANGQRDYISPAVAGRTTGNGGIQVVSRGAADAAALVGERGFVMIDAVDVLALAPNVLRRTLYRHEVGHALGLGHVDRPESLMHGTLSQSRPDLTRGDVAGIQKLAAMPCQG
jgi:hypothetical protein